MKKIVLLISFAVMALFASSTVSAQGKYGADSVECIKYLSYYTEYYKQKNYASAMPNWRQAYKYCPPSSRYNLLSNGTTLIKDHIKKNAKNPIYKDQLVDSLMVIYDQIVEYFPKYAISNLNKKALDMYNYKQDEPKLLFEELDKIVAVTKENTNTNVFPIYMNTACNLYKDGLLDPEKVISVYETSVAYMGQVTPKNETEAKLIATKLDDVEKIFIGSQVASCENLIALFTPRYEAAPEDLDLAKNIVKMMSTNTEGCTDNDLYLNSVNTMYKMEPSASSAYYLYKLYSGRGEYENAVKYLEESIASEETDADTDANYNYELAVMLYKNGNAIKAVSAAQNAIEMSDVIDGKAYMLLGTIWGGLSCSGNEIETRAKYWVAVDYMSKAKAADETLTEDANNLIRQYSAYYPQTAEAFMYDITDGQSYTVSCGGLRAVTTVRTQK